MSSARRLFGREQELAELRSALSAGLAGSGRVALLSGEAGIGKTRLAEELAAEWRSRPSNSVRGSKSGGAARCCCTWRGRSGRRAPERRRRSAGPANLPVKNVLGKLGFASRVQVAAWAARQGLSTFERKPSP